jgi:magnesium transporter
MQYPKIEAYDGYLYVILHGIDFHGGSRGFGTHDVDFFLGPQYLVTVHDGHARSINDMREHALKNPRVVGDGPVPLFHRLVDAMVDDYRPEVEKLEDRLDELEKAIFANPDSSIVRQLLQERRQVALLRRIITPQRDVMTRLARREFVDISTEMSFRFRDVYDHLVRLSDDALMFHDRISGMLEAHYSNVNNRLNEVMKVLTVVTTLLMPLSILTGMFGMNIALPHLPGGEGAQFWWLAGIMAVIVFVMLAFFRGQRWI